MGLLDRVKGMIFGSDELTTSEVEKLLEDIKDINISKQLILSLTAAREADKQIIENYEQDLIGIKEDLEDLKQSYLRILDEHKNFIQKYDFSDLLRVKVRELEKEIDQAEKQYKQLETEKKEILNELLQFTHNKVTTGVIEDNLGKFEVVTELQNFRDYHMHSIFMEIKKYRKDDEFKGNFDAERAFVYATLSKILLSGTNILRPMNEAIEDIVPQIEHVLAIDTDRMPDTVKQKIRNIAMQGLHLVKKIIRSNQPIQLKFIPEGTVICRRELEHVKVMSGSQKTGCVVFTIFPGCIIGEESKEIVMQPEVFIKEEENN